MNIEQRIKELEETNQKLYEAAEFVDKQNDDLLKVSKELEKEHKRIIKINKDLQSEVERYKSLWKTCEVDFVSLQGKSNEIIAELKAEKVEIFRSLEKELRLHELTTNERSCRNEEFIHSVINRSINLQLSLIREKFNKFKGKHLPKPPKQNH